MFQLYALTDSRLTNLTHAAQVSELIAGGARLIQLRDKRTSPREFYDDARQALSIARRAKATLIINDRVDIALALRADGVHLGQDDLPPAPARRLLGENVIIGRSTHNEAQAIAAARMNVDYIAIGPVFATTSKANPHPVIGVEGVRRVRAALDANALRVPLVAIGGIDAMRAKEVLEAGADCVAVINSLLREPLNIRERTREFLASLDSNLPPSRF